MRRKSDKKACSNEMKYAITPIEITREKLAVQVADATYLLRDWQGPAKEELLRRRQLARLTGL